MDKVIFNYSKLKGLIVEKGLTGALLAEKIGMDKSTFSQKLNNKYPFTQQEIYNICLALDITDNKEYFFSVEC